MNTLLVRAYNVRFGDAILIEVPDRDPVTQQTTLRRILMDVGNSMNTEGGDDSMFRPAVDDLLQRLDGAPIDLYVMTHEHLDHVQGLFHVAEKYYPNGELKRRLNVQYAWMTASAAENYYDDFPNAKKKAAEFEAAYGAVAAFAASLPAGAVPGLVTLLALNDTRNTAKCVAYLRQLANHPPTYVYRGCSLEGTHPFREAKFEIWAPERDTTAYYGRLQANPTQRAAAPLPQGGVAPSESKPLPPPGVDAGAFYELVDSRSHSYLDNLLAIDQAANNTSVVFCLEWRGWRLLFTGDAEVRSWRKMSQMGVLKPVQFLKVSHHSSSNGTPDDDLLEQVLPLDSPDRSKRRAMFCTWENTYSGIPHAPTIERLKDRCGKVVSNLDDPGKPYVQLRFRG